MRGVGECAMEASRNSDRPFPTPSYSQPHLNTVLFWNFVKPKIISMVKFRTPIDHFHYDVTRAKVSGSCSKDRAQCRAIAGKCQKISRSAMPAKASYQVFYKVMCSIAAQIQGNSAWSFYVFFSINEELRSVVNEHFNGKLFSQVQDTECVAGKRVLTMLPIQFPS